MISERSKRTFWKRVDKRGAIPAHCTRLGVCWEWCGELDEEGYGRFHHRRNETTRANRISWEIAFSPPLRLFVLHKCDNPRCVRPSHLFLGTQAENNRDAREKKRIRPARGDAHWSRRNPEKRVRGAIHYNAKLTEKDVCEIRVSPHSEKTLAEKYGVGQQAINSVRRRKTWKHIP